MLAIAEGYGSSWDFGGHSGAQGSYDPSESVVRGSSYCFPVTERVAMLC